MSKSAESAPQTDYQLAAYLLDDADRKLLSREIPNGRILFWPPTLSAESLDSAVADKFFFFSVASYCLVDIRSGTSFEPYSYLMGALTRLLDQMLEKVYVLGSMERVITRGDSEEEVELRQLANSGAIRTSVTIVELASKISIDLQNKGFLKR